MPSTIKLLVQESKGSYFPCINDDKFKDTKLLEVCHNDIVGAIVSEEHDTHQVQYIDVDSLVPLHLHLLNVIIFLNLSSFIKTLLKILSQLVKTCMSALYDSHHVLNLLRIKP